jgi:hypothetical protein
MTGDPPQRPRPSSRTFFVRRVGALVIVGALVYAVVRVATGLVGGGESVADADAAAETSNGVEAVTGGASTDLVADGSVANGSGSDGSVADESSPDPSTSDAPTSEPLTSEAPTSEPDDDAPPSPSNPAKVYVVGDSDAGTFGPYLNRLLDGTNLTETELNYKVSSGLSRPDFFDWHGEFERTLPEVDPDIVVVTFGGNDAQGLAVAGGEFIVGDPVSNEDEWTEEYQRRAGEAMDTLLEDDRVVIWVGIPNDDNPEVTERMSIQDQAAKAAAAERPGVIFIDTWSRFSGRDGGWAEFVIDPRDGQGKDVRAGDGFHLNETGAEILALDIAQAVRDALREMGANI